MNFEKNHSYNPFALSHRFSPFPKTFFKRLVPRAVSQKVTYLSRDWDYGLFIQFAENFLLTIYRPALVAQWWGCRTWTWWFWVRDPVEANFLSGVFSPLVSAEACQKSSEWLWKESCVSTGVRKPGNMCVTVRHDMTLAVKIALNLNTKTKF